MAELMPAPAYSCSPKCSTPCYPSQTQPEGTSQIHALRSRLWPAFNELPTCQDTARSTNTMSHLFNHISASVAPVLGQAEPCISFSTSRMFCSVLNLAGLES